MKLIPSLRQKKRYILFEIQAEKEFTVAEVQEVVQYALHDFLGQLGLATASPLFLKEKFAKNHFTLKVNNNYVDEVKSAVILIKKIKNTPVLLRSITTSGMLKKATILKSLNS